MDLPDRAHLETALATIRSQVAEHRLRLEKLISNRRHLYRRESVLLGLVRQANDPEEVQRQLNATLAELDRYNAEIDAIEASIEGLEAEALRHIEGLEIHRRIPGIVRDLSVLWSCRASRGRLAPSLPSYAGDLIRNQLQEAGREFQAGEKDLAAITKRLQKHYRI